MLPGLSTNLLTHLIRNQLLPSDSLLAKWSPKIPNLTVSMLRTITLGFDACQKALAQAPSNQAKAMEQELKSNFLSEPSGSQGVNLVWVILKKGYLDVEATTRSEYYESALALLGKIAQCFPDTLTALWSSELEQALRKLMLPPNEPSPLAAPVD